VTVSVKHPLVWLPDLDVLARATLIFFVFAILPLPVFSQTQITLPAQDTLIIEDAPEMEVFSFGKTVIVKKQVKGVLSFGGDVIIEGKVSGEVATIGGSVIQKKEAFIGGDVIIFGGSYRTEANEPLRTDGKETVVYAGYEEELRSIAKNPSQILSPQLTTAFIVQRLLSLLFWFGISLIISFVTPGSVSRAVARLSLSPLKVFGIGGLSFIVITLGVMLSLGFLPGFVSGVIGLMAFVVVMLAYVFGRVVLQAGLGKFALKIFSGKKPSETLSLLTGAFLWTLLLSVPYVWTAALFVLFTASLGLVFTARRGSISWETT
jgi:hypothetical protein